MTSSLRKQNVALPRDLLKDFTLERLQELIDKDEEFDAFVLPLSEDLDEMKNINKKRDELNDTNRQLSLEITGKRPSYENKKAKLVEQALLAIELKETYNRKLNQLKMMTSSVDKNSILKDMESALKEAEKESDELAEEYTAGNTDITSDEFISRFLTSRTSYWSRKVKVDKMPQIIKNTEARHSISEGSMGGDRPPYPLPSQSLPTHPEPFLPTGSKRGSLPSAYPPRNESPTYESSPYRPTPGYPTPGYPPTSSYRAPLSNPTGSYRAPPPNPPGPYGAPPTGSYRAPPPPTASYRPPYVPPSTGGYPQPSYPQQSYRPPPAGGRYPYSPQTYTPPSQYGGYPRR